MLLNYRNYTQVDFYTYTYTCKDKEKAYIYILYIHVMWSSLLSSI